MISFLLDFPYNFGTVGKRGTIPELFQNLKWIPAKEVELEQREVGRLSENRAVL